MKIKRKLKNQSGLTLAEMLVATIILLLVSTIVVQGIPVAKNAYEKVVVAANAKVMLTTAITALRNELSTAQRIEQTDNTSITYYSSNRGADSKIYLSSGTGVDSNYKVDTIMLQEYADYGDVSNGDTSTLQLLNSVLNSDLESGASVSVSARELIASLEAQRGGTDKLYLCCDKIVYDKANKQIKITGLKVCRTSDAKSLAQLGKDLTDNILSIRVIPNEAKFQEAVAPPPKQPTEPKP